MPPDFPQDCWKCADKIAWELSKGNWHKIPGHPGYYMEHDHTRMSPCPGQPCVGWVPTPRDVSLITFALNDLCQKVAWPNKTHVFGEPENGWFGNVCHRQQPIPCPEPTPTPGPSPTPGPTPTPGGPCPAIAGLGGQVAQFQFQHHTVTMRREQPGDVYVANGPADRVNFDTTVYYGCAAPRCDSEHDHSLARCEDLRGQRWRVLSGNVRNCEPTNGNGAEDQGRGFGFACDAGPGEGAVEACTVQPWISTETGEHVLGSACKTIRWRID